MKPSRFEAVFAGAPARPLPPGVLDRRQQRAGRLTVLDFVGFWSNPRFRSAVWRCRCDCGQVVYRDSAGLTPTHVRGCGCTMGGARPQPRADFKRQRAIDLRVVGDGTGDRLELRCGQEHSLSVSRRQWVRWRSEARRFPDRTKLCPLCRAEPRKRGVE